MSDFRIFDEGINGLLWARGLVSSAADVAIVEKRELGLEAPDGRKVVSSCLHAQHHGLALAE